MVYKKSFKNEKKVLTKLSKFFSISYTWENTWKKYTKKKEDNVYG